MWTRVDHKELPAALARVTTAVWQYSDIAVIGVMRSVMLGPPCIWAEIRRVDFATLRKLPKLTDDFQQLIYAKTIYAETVETEPRHVDLLLFAGFHELLRKNGRVLLERSL